jgi:hypothetical protein
MINDDHANGTAPRTFKASVGGYMGPSYRLEFGGLALRYASSPHRYEFDQDELLTISPSAWARFATKLDTLNVWSWSSSYADETVLDGTSWAVVIHWGERRLESSGSNAYPQSWDGFCDAVMELLEGREFQ